MALWTATCISCQARHAESLLFYGFLFDGIYQYSDFNQQPNGTYVLKINIT